MFKVYNEDDGSYNLVEEPDPSISYTYADYLQWKFEERLELLKGKIFKMAAPNTGHQKIVLKLATTIEIFLKNNPCQPFVAPFDVRLPVQNRKKDTQVSTVVQPDICIVCDESKIDERGCCGAPDFIVEVLSPGNSAKEVKLKFELYQEARVKEYWIVYPGEESIAVFILNDQGRYNGATLYAGKDYIQSASVPGLGIKLTDIFTK